VSKVYKGDMAFVTQHKKSQIKDIHFAAYRHHVKVVFTVFRFIFAVLLQFPDRINYECLHA